MILFSVIIPHYNSVQYLEKLIRSIPEDGAVQVIVVDDKSTEDTTVIEQYVLARGGLFIHNITDKKGAGVCRNLGLKEAKGKWLLFADADDYYVEDAFDKLEKFMNATADIVYFIPTSKYRDTARDAERHIIYEDMIKDYLKNPSRENEIALRYKFIIPVSKMIKAELVQKKEIFFDEIPASNDTMFSIKCAYHAEDVEVSSDCIYCITKSEGTLTTKHDENNFWSRVQVYKDRYIFWNQHLKPAELRSLGIVRRCGVCVIINALQQGYGLGMAWKIYCYFKENNVKLVDFRNVGTVVYNKVVRKSG